MKEFVDSLLGQPPIYNFDPRRTALFASAKTGKSVHWYNKWALRRKIMKDSIWLLRHGYQYMIVDYGTDYGHLAMQVLLKMRAHRQFTLCSVKKMGQHQVSRRDWKRYETWFLHCDHLLGCQDNNGYYKVMENISAISDAKGLLYNKERIPLWISLYWRIEGSI